MKQAGSPAASQAVSFSGRQSNQPILSQLSQENLSIHADRHATYSESDFTEAETGIAKHVVRPDIGVCNLVECAVA